jgi:hypothetical protein
MKMSNSNTRETSNCGQLGAANKSGKKYDYWSSKQRQSSYKGAIENLPVLEIQSRTQYSSPKVLYTSYVRREYGEIADIFMVNDYSEFAKVEYDEDLLEDNDPFGFERKKLKSEYNCTKRQFIIWKRTNRKCAQ